MKTRTGRPRGLTRLARALGLDHNPLRRAIDRADAWIRVGMLAVFLIAGPMAALAAGHWAYLLTIADIFDYTTIRREETAFPPWPEAGVSTSRL